MSSAMTTASPLGNEKASGESTFHAYTQSDLRGEMEVNMT
jgi:hypothetical protein